MEEIYGVEKIEQSLNNFFRKGNLSALRELGVSATQRCKWFHLICPRRKSPACRSHAIIPRKRTPGS